MCLPFLAMPSRNSLNAPSVVSNCPTQRGFGLIELMVSISIIALVSGVILTKHTAFNGAVLLRNQTYELAFAIRQAQLLAVSGTDEAVGNSRQYGVYVDVTEPNEYHVFRDESQVGPNKGRYDSGDVEIGPVGRLDSRFRVREVSTAAGASLTTGGFSVTFIRPNFDAVLNDESGPELSGPIYVDIARTGATGNGPGEVRRVEVTSTGQIQVVTY